MRLFSAEKSSKFFSNLLFELVNARLAQVQFLGDVHIAVTLGQPFGHLALARGKLGVGVLPFERHFLKLRLAVRQVSAFVVQVAVQPLILDAPAQPINTFAF